MLDVGRFSVVEQDLKVAHVWNANRNAPVALLRTEFTLSLSLFLGERVQMRQKSLLHAAQIAALERHHPNGARRAIIGH
jgi:hypothetical protein